MLIDLNIVQLQKETINGENLLINYTESTQTIYEALV